MQKYCSLIILSFFLFINLFATANRVTAATTDTAGWIWGGTDDGAGINTGVGWISANNTNIVGSTVSYAVNIPPTDGALSGYAWSENLGWISFNAFDLWGCPDGNCICARSSDSLVGWARILSIRDALAVGNSGGYQGWIHLGGSGYGIKLNSNGTITKSPTTSYAWSDEFGWLDFSGLTPPCTPDCGDTSTHCIGTYDSLNHCGTGDCTGTMDHQCVCPTIYSCQSVDCGKQFAVSAYDFCGTSWDCSATACSVSIDCLDGCDDADWKEVSP